MRATTNQFNWNVAAVDPPRLTTRQWVISGVAGALLLVTAILQLVSFADFRDYLNSAGLPGPTAWAVCIILAEIWGAAAFFKLRLSYLFRAFSATLAVLAAGFWFVENLQLVANGKGETLSSSGFFGRFLAQKPGWWTVIEVTIALFLIIWALDIARPMPASTRRR
jgi:hypothetical protein